MVAQTKSRSKTTSRKRMTVVHDCTQSDRLARQEVILERLSVVTLGNGHPEDGMLFKFRKFMDDHDVVVRDIKEIKDKLSTVTEINTELEVQRRVKAELEKSLKDQETIKDKKDDIKNKKKSITWQGIATIIAGVSLLVLMIFSILNYTLNKETKTDVVETKRGVNDIGQPLILDSRGKTYSLPIGFSLKYYPKDFRADSVNKRIMREDSIKRLK